MNQRETSVSKSRGRMRREAGLGVLEMLVGIAIIGTVTAIGVMGVNSVRANMRFQHSTRELAGYLERVRTDAVRRHVTDGTASVRVVDASTYTVTMDFDYNGTIDASDTHTITLQPGILLSLTPRPADVIFDWRGRIASNISFVLLNGTQQQTVSMTGAGDVTINANVTLPSTTATPFPTP